MKIILNIKKDDKGLFEGEILNARGEIIEIFKRATPPYILEKLHEYTSVPSN